MERNKELETSISQALLQVEKDLFLPQNTLVDTLPKDHSPNRPEKKKSLRVFLRIRTFNKYNCFTFDLHVSRLILESEGKKI